MEYTPRPFALVAGLRSYSPELQAIINYVEEELKALSRALVETTVLESRTISVEPKRPREGMIVVADGVDWNPGFGGGAYAYFNNSWVYLSGNVSESLLGSSTLDVLPHDLREHTTLIVSLVDDRFVSFAEGEIAFSDNISAYSGVTITNSTGGKYTTRKRLLVDSSVNALRLTHDGDGQPLGALIEDTATNLLLYSEQIDVATWAKVSGISVSANATIAPDGTTTVEKLTPATAVALSSQYVSQNVSKAASALYFTFSVFAKKAEFDRVRVLFNDNANSANTVGVVVSLEDGSIVSAAGTSGTFTNPSSTVVDAGNGWWRISVSALTAVETVIRNRCYIYDSTATNGDGTSGAYIWGMQAELARAPSSYIETTTAQVSRSADVLSLPVANFTSDEITIAGEFVAPWKDEVARTVFCLKNGTDSLQMDFAVGSSVPAIAFTVAGTEQFGGSAVQLNPGETYKFYVAASKAERKLSWKFTGLAAGSVGPTSPLTETAGFTPTSVDIGNVAGADQLRSTISSFSIVDRAWTNAEGLSFTDGVDHTHQDLNDTIAYNGASGRNYTNSYNTTTLTTLTGVANRMEIAPWVAPIDLTITTVGLLCTTAVAGALGKVVCYDSDSDGRPNNLLFETGTLDFSTTGYKTVSQSYNFEKGKCYWLGIRHSATAALNAHQSYTSPGLPYPATPTTSAVKLLRRSLAFATAAPSSWGWLATEETAASVIAVFLTKA